MYFVTLILTLANMHWFHLMYVLEPRGIPLFLRVFLVFYVFFFLYRFSLMFLFKVHRGLPAAVILLFGYIWGGTGLVKWKELARLTPTFTALWIFAGLVIFFLVLKVFSRALREEEESVPQVSQHVVNLILCLWLTLVWSEPSVFTRVMVSLPALGFSAFLLILGRKVHTGVKFNRVVTVLIVFMLMFGLWFDVPHWPPRLKAGRRSVLLITVEGLRPGYAKDFHSEKAGTLRFTNAYSSSPRGVTSLTRIFSLLDSRLLPEMIPSHMDCQAVTGCPPEAYPPEMFHGFDARISTRVIPDSLLAVMNFLPLVAVGQLFSPVEWKHLCLRMDAGATTSRAIRVLNSVKEPFFLWVSYPSPLLDKVPGNVPVPEMKHAEIRVEEYEKDALRTVDEIGRLLKYLDQNGFFPQTHVLIAGLNGYELYEEGSFGRTDSLFPHMLHVPLVLCSSHIKEDRTQTDEVTLKRVLPTLAQWMNLDPAEWEFHTRSLLSSETNGDGIWTAGVGEAEDRELAVYSPEYILLYDETCRRFRLYDRHGDPFCRESVHLLRPDRVEALKPHLKDQL